MKVLEIPIVAKTLIGLKTNKVLHAWLLANVALPITLSILLKLFYNLSSFSFHMSVYNFCATIAALVVVAGNIVAIRKYPPTYVIIFSYHLDERHCSYMAV